MSKGDVALMNIYREASYSMILCSIQKKKFFTVSQPQYVLKTVLNFWEFFLKPHVLIKKVLIKKTLVNLFMFYVILVKL